MTTKRESFTDRSQIQTEIQDVFSREYDGLIRTAYLLTYDIATAEDLVQDAFTALSQRWATLTDRSKAAGYLRVCVLNGAKSLHRHRSVMRKHDAAQVPTHAPSADWSVLLKVEHREVAAAVSRLPRRLRQVVVLRYWLEMTDLEIANTLEISTGTVRANASKALTALSKLMEES